MHFLSNSLCSIICGVINMKFYLISLILFTQANAKVMEVEESGHTPMEFIGQFLNLICGEKDLCKRRRSSQSDSFLCLASHSSKKISVTDGKRNFFLVCVYL